MKKHLFLTGPSGVGKTTIIKEALVAQIAYAGGFLTERVTDDSGKLLGFDLCELTAGPLLWLGNLTRKPGLDQRRGLRGIVWVLLILGGVLGTAGGCKSLPALFLPLLGGGDAGLLGEAGAYLLRSYAVPLVLAVLFATPWPLRGIETLRQGKRSARVLAVLEPVALALLLLLGTAWLVNGAALTFLP